MGGFFTDVLDDVFGIETQKKVAPKVDVAPVEELEKEKDAIDKVNEKNNKAKRSQAIRNIGGIAGGEVSAIGSGTTDNLFGN